LAGHSTATLQKPILLAGGIAFFFAALSASAIAEPAGKSTLRNVPHPALAPWHKPSAPPAKTPKKAKLKTPGEDAAPVPPAPPPDVWSQGDVADSLKSCVQKLAHIQARVEIAEPFKNGRCGAPAAVKARLIGTRHPLKVSPPATLRCKMAVALYWFIEKSLQPAAISILGSPVKNFHGISSYSCRNRNGAKTGRLSEHALANALDVGVFKLANGKTISVLRDWGPTVRDREAPTEDKAKPKLVATTGKRVAARPNVRTQKNSQATPIPIKKSDVLKAPERSGRKTEPKSQPSPARKPKPAKVAKAPPPTKESRFLKRIHKEACQYFGTVLGPEANEAHRDHFHFDMAPRRRSNYCR